MSLRCSSSSVPEGLIAQQNTPGVTLIRVQQEECTSKNAQRNIYENAWGGMGINPLTSRRMVLDGCFVWDLLPRLPTHGQLKGHTVSCSRRMTNQDIRHWAWTISSQSVTQSRSLAEIQGDLRSSLCCVWWRVHWWAHTLEGRTLVLKRVHRKAY